MQEESQSDLQELKYIYKLEAVFEHGDFNRTIQELKLGKGTADIGYIPYLNRTYRN